MPSRVPSTLQHSCMPTLWCVHVPLCTQSCLVGRQSCTPPARARQRTAKHQQATMQQLHHARQTRTVQCRCRHMNNDRHCDRSLAGWQACGHHTSPASLPQCHCCPGDALTNDARVTTTAQPCTTTAQPCTRGSKHGQRRHKRANSPDRYSNSLHAKLIPI